jgi:hypothetical protein
MLVKDKLEHAGHTVSSSWLGIAAELDGDCDRVRDSLDRMRNAQLDLAEVRAADVLVVLVPSEGGTGMWIELGYALGHHSIRVMAATMYGGNDVRMRSVFLELVECFDDVDSLIKELQE